MKLKNVLLILALSMFVILGGCAKPVDNHDDDDHEEEQSHGEEGHMNMNGLENLN
jgi:protein involved in sex pheromone biosynthesis